MEEDKNLQLEAKATAVKHELEHAKRQAEENKDIAEQFKKEKQILYEGWSSPVIISWKISYVYISLR